MRRPPPPPQTRGVDRTTAEIKTNKNTKLIDANEQALERNKTQLYVCVAISLVTTISTGLLINDYYYSIIKTQFCRLCTSLHRGFCLSRFTSVTVRLIPIFRRR